MTELRILKGNSKSLHWVRGRFDKFSWERLRNLRRAGTWHVGCIHNVLTDQTEIESPCIMLTFLIKGQRTGIIPTALTQTRTTSLCPHISALVT